MLKEYSTDVQESLYARLRFLRLTSIRRFNEGPAPLLDRLETRDNKRLIGHVIVIEANDKVPSFHGNNVARKPIATIANGDKVTDERSIHTKNYTPLSRESLYAELHFFTSLYDGPTMRYSRGYGITLRNH